MSVMIKLRLPEAVKDFGEVQSLPGLADLQLDQDFGLIPLDPRSSLYAVRTADVDDLDRRRSLSPEIVEAYGDVRISHFGPPGQPEPYEAAPAPPAEPEPAAAPEPAARRKPRRASKASARKR